MRVFYKDQDKKKRTIDRSFFDATNGRVNLAMDRIQELYKEFPDDSKIIYAEGLIRVKHLGQGLRAFELFKKAFKIDDKHFFALFNAMKYSPNEHDFREFANLFIDLVPHDKAISGINAALNRLDYTPYWTIIYEEGITQEKAQNLGAHAAFMELILQDDKAKIDEVATRRWRAENLRLLDQTQSRYHEAILEFFSPDERITLVEALHELEKALDIDEYDAELWNLKAAWLHLLGRYQEAIESADQAIKLRPFSYERPYVNKAHSLYSMGKETEALSAAQKALEQAKTCGSQDRLENCRKLVDNFSTEKQIPSLRDMERMISQMIRNTEVTSDLEIGEIHMSTEKWAEGVLKRSLKTSSLMDYANIIAELLSILTPETVFCTMNKVGKKAPNVRKQCIYGSLYVTAHSNGVQQRDAARFLILIILGELWGPAMRNSYRELILSVSDAATDEMVKLKQILRYQLGRTNQLFPQLIADQERISINEREQAKQNILSKF